MSERPCILCNNSIDDPLQLGEKLTFEDTTAHLYCLLLTSNLVQGGEDDEGIYGFLPKDIKNEVSRTKKLLCHYCHQRSATIGCCVKACRRSFHLPCALEHDCRLEFSKTFRSFCDEHHNIKKPKNAHKPTDLCTICYDEMGKFNIIRSIALPCCNKDAWCHKLCLQKYAQSSGYFLKCPLCKDSDQFRDWIAERGVFIPDRDAKWEVDETGPNTFYGFEQHNERPTKCVAKVCKCPKGRNYQVDTENHEHSLVFCEYCGSLAVHLDCLDDDEFRCDDCTEVVIRTRAQAALSNSANGQTASATIGVASSSSSDFMVTDSEANKREKYRMIAAKFGITDCYVPLICLRDEDFNSTSKINYHKFLAMEKTEKVTNSDQDIAKKDKSSDENEIEPMLRRNGKINAYFLPVSDSESDIEIAPVKVHQTPKKNVFADSDSEHKSHVTNNAHDMNNLNTQQITKSTSTPNNFIERKLFSGEDESERSSVIIRNFFRIDSDDDVLAGKENEKPIKSVAVVRPFSVPEPSPVQNINIKTENYPCEAFYPSSGGTSDDSSYKSGITQRYDYLKNIPKKEDRTTSIANYPSPSIVYASSPDASKHTQNKRKFRSVRSYFCDTSSSDEEVTEPKPKRKSPKQMKKISSAQVDRPSNQSTIVNFFQRKLNQGI